MNIPGSLACVCLACLPLCASAAELALRIEGVQAMTGTLRIAVYDREQDWLTSRTATARVVDLAGRERVAGAVELVLEGLPDASVAVALFHDRDGDGELDRGLFGLPAEPVAFSGSHRWKIPPPYAEAAIVLRQTEPITLALRLR